VTKYNRWNMGQSRILLLTNKFLYNIHKSHVQRRISISGIKAVTKSTKTDNQQFIVHIMSEYDYMFSSEFRREIFDALKWVYWKENGTNIHVYGVPDRLKDYATTKKDILNGVEVNPKENYRLTAEDTFQEMPKAATKDKSVAGGSSMATDVSEIDAM